MFPPQADPFPKPEHICARFMQVHTVQGLISLHLQSLRTVSICGSECLSYIFIHNLRHYHEGHPHPSAHQPPSLNHDPLSTSISMQSLIHLTSLQCALPQVSLPRKYTTYLTSPSHLLALLHMTQTHSSVHNSTDTFLRLGVADAC